VPCDLNEIASYTKWHFRRGGGGGVRNNKKYKVHKPLRKVEVKLKTPKFSRNYAVTHPLRYSTLAF
jgi:hypothetical protein